MFGTSQRQRNRTACGGATPKVASVVAVDGHDERTVLALAASLAPGLAPELVTAIVDAARERDICFEAVDGVGEQSPAGVAGTMNGHSVVVGNAALFRDRDLSLDILGDGPERLRRRGEHVMFVCIDGRIAGFLGVVHARE